MAKSKIQVDSAVPSTPASLDSDGWKKQRTLHSSLAEAKLGVMSEVGYIKKKTAKGLSYTYAAETDLIEAVRPSMLRHGITVSPISVDVQHSGSYKTSTGKVMQLVRSGVGFRFSAVCEGPDGNRFVDSEDTYVLGEGSDLGDKAGPKAMTMALKYALRQFFLMATGDDPDKYASQEVVAYLNAEETAVSESFLKFMGAVETADSPDRLKGLRDAYLNRDFTDEQVRTLEQANTLRASVLMKNNQEQ